MAVKTNIDVKITATLELTEGQLRALNAMICYGDDAFLKAFYVKLGTHYMKPFERDLRDLFTQLRNKVPSAIEEVSSIRKRIEAAQEGQ
jgi:hypothetical protein